MAGFVFALVLESGEPADPPALNTRFSVWRKGDEFVAGAELRHSASSESAKQPTRPARQPSSSTRTGSSSRSVS
jgi:hypothetical protein